MKEKLEGMLGVFGNIVWWALSALIAAAPLVYLNLPMWLNILLVVSIASMPVAGGLSALVLYVWSAFAVFRAPQAPDAVIWLVGEGFYLLAVLIPLAAALCADRFSLVKQYAARLREGEWA